MKLSITIESDNIGTSTDDAVARIVHGIASKIAAGHEGGKVRDENGNTVGEWSYERNEDRDEE